MVQPSRCHFATPPHSLRAAANRPEAARQRGAMAEKAGERRLITAAELAKHNTEKDCWMSIHGLVLDLPKDFLDEHPGGPDVVTCMAGKDATSDFEDIAHSDTAREWASKFIVGYTEDADEETKTTKLIPKSSEISGKRGGGGGSAVIPAIVVVIVAALAFLFLKG
uniref:Cytochrome b5 heme-binding domain-containing protein n=1 Tax=Alexandrium andersonii TaxID=327968 RepID=A0A7S2E2J4_9DINO